MNKKIPSYHAYLLNSAASMLVLLGGGLYPYSAVAQSSNAMFARGTSMDAFNRAGEALRRGLTKTQESEDLSKEVVVKAKSNHPRLAKKSLPNPLSQLTSYAPSTKKKQKESPSTSTNKLQSRAIKSSSPTSPKTPSKTSKKHTSNDSEIKRLRAELSQLKQDLAVAELEVSRLSDIVQSKSFSTLKGHPSNTRAMTPKVSSKTRHSNFVRPAHATITRSAPVVDMQVATISSTKAHLRLGPSTEHSRLMTLRKGSRLAVETRQGEWYRVFAPNGQRAWIHGSLVSFGNGSQTLNDGSAITTRGYNEKR